jgi:hypothetical protein
MSSSGRRVGGSILGILPTALLALITLPGCSTGSYADQVRSGLRSHSWAAEAKPQRGQSDEVAKADWQGCEDEVVTTWSAKGFGGSQFMPILSYYNTIAPYKDFEGCLRERGYSVEPKKSAR